MEHDGWNINTGRSGRSIIPRSHEASAMSLQWWKQPLDGWNHVLCPTPLPGMLSWASKSKFYGDMAPQKNWVRQWDSFLKQPHRYLGQRAWHWVGVSYLLQCTSLSENQMIQQTATNYTESSGWWNLQTLGYTFSKGHLLSCHQRIYHSSWPCPTKTVMHCRRG